MTTDVQDVEQGPVTTTSLSPRWATFLLAAAAWNVWVWATRALNLINDDRDFTVGFLVVHFVLFTVSLGIAGGLGVLGWKLRRGHRASR